MKTTLFANTTQKLSYINEISEKIKYYNKYIDHNQCRGTDPIYSSC